MELWADFKSEKNIANCTVTVPDQMTNDNKIYYRFESANNDPSSSQIGEIVKDGETTLTLGTDYEFGTLTISGTGAMNAAASYADYPWFEYKNYINTITIGEGITSIAGDAY